MSFARTQTGTAIATWLEPQGSGMQVLRTWAESGNVTVDSERMDDVGGMVRWLDVDGDGSAEIVVVGQIRDTDTYALHVYGAAAGRWARTRPVWNELDYDVTTVQDDGQLAVWPLSSWESYNSFRAQPAHDGPHPDLTVTTTDLCCDADTVQLAVQPSNLGSVDALAGAIITLSTNDGTGWRTVATHVLDEGIDAHIAATGFVFEVPRADWGKLQVNQITGTGGDECDFVNDRVQVALTCGD